MNRFEELARKNEALFFEHTPDDLNLSDPEFAQFFTNFAFGEVQEDNPLTLKERVYAVLAALLGCQGIDIYRVFVEGALHAGIDPADIQEITYQAVAYLGIGRVYPFIKANNEAFRKAGFILPLAPASTTTPDDRREKGTAKQVELFGENMQDFWKANRINYWLADNCFGDYYTRSRLDNSIREMITFCYLTAQGGCENQLRGHIQGNFRVGNDKEKLTAVLQILVPVLGYPRILNALGLVNAA